ncbi:MAG TPA: sugar ABC transporter permease [Aggregatilinea sp.]|jgi:sn-glycerol 3-phosphate transport system permease protein|uniref:carbohydrate ABC transporter permease n=1 Tax=Aggregatilinea sp. TaxID=2806333 RepID=UPI002B8565A0|nr:sugar ABC transporter permease [Aggregatilinea sp.]HML20340.1 sugar ABC transporter permease [Aggregatilinea sp.]
MRSANKLKIAPQLAQSVFYLLIVLFLLFFFVPRYRGLETLLTLLVDAVKSTPAFVRNIADYFRQVPGEQFWPSALIGAGVGLLGTLAAALYHPGETRLTAQRLLLFGGVGTLLGSAGSQILMVPLEHCTYAPDIDRAQFRLGLIITAASALLMLVPLWAVVRRNSQPSIVDHAGKFKNYPLPYLFLLPTLMVLAVFLYYPTISVMLTSLRRKIFPLPQERAVCLENYVSLASDTIYRNSLTTTLIITVLIVLFSLSISLGIATLASQKIRYAGVYRTLLIWPYAISPVVTGFIFLSLFRESGAGLINWALRSTIGITPGWLTDQALAPWVIVAAAVWNIIGFNILFYIAGLQNVPQDLLEAASLDGANRFQRFMRITFPLLSPFTFFLLVTNVTYSFYGIYGTVEALTPNGGPPLGPGGIDGSATNVLIFKLYSDAFTSGAPAGLAGAQAVLLFLMVAGLTLVQFRFIERRVTYEA